MIGDLTNHLWQSTLFAGAAALLTLGFRRNQAKVRFWLWFGASLKFFVPFSLLMSLGSQVELAPATRGIAAQMVAPAMALTVPPIKPPPEMLPAAPAARDTLYPVAVVCLGVWVIGLGGVALMRFRDWLRIRMALRFSSPMDLSARVEVRSSRGLLEPGVVGLLRPVLLVPAGIEEHLTPAQLEAVVAHELCHVQRRDNLFASIHMVVEAAFWFHPLVWWLGARLMEERERACDEQVLSLGGDPRVYAEGLLNVCKLYVESPLVCVSGVTGSNLRKRIEAIMANHRVLKLTFAKKVTLTVAGTMAVAVPLAIGVLNAPLSKAEAAGPKFEAASVRTCSDTPGFKRGAGFSVSTGRLNTGCMALAEMDHTGLIQRAYVRFADGRAHPSGLVPIAGGPSWIRSELFDIDARASGSPNEELMQGPMLQALLEDQFRLKIHRETRDVPVYALTVEQGGSRLKTFAPGSCVPMPLKVPLPALAAAQEYCKVRVGIQPPAVDAQGATLTEFAQLLDLVLDRPVVDKTELAGQFDIRLKFAISEATPRFLPGGDLARFADAASNRDAPSIFAALKELGLKLEPTQGARAFLVIDHVERPTAH
ncbi:M56 family metallopeptidase [uncultured Paludibaculum sp.]|uniref:M56 family metallopeptidase n=1 Tax=uncultured Paludibaculum sp. TaxID=1765020 RepID=UPI002AAAC385|nr:M56 family metallopeptidase [uncultured Paludibaculum sp.]